MNILDIKKQARLEEYPPPKSRNILSILIDVIVENDVPEYGRNV